LRKKKNIIQEIPEQIQESIKVSWGDIKDLFTDKLWDAEGRFAKRWWDSLVHFVKVVRITLDKFAENRMGFQCLALAYCMTLALIPFVAFVLFIANGLRISDEVEQLIRSAISSNAEMVNLILEKADNIIDAAQSSPVGIISALMFLWTIIWLMFQIERVFNNVWGIRKVPRNIFKRFGFYFLALFLSPFVVLIFGYEIAMYSNVTSIIGWDFGGVESAVTSFLGWVIFGIVTALVFSVMYKFIPAVHVQYRHALKAAIFCGHSIFALSVPLFGDSDLCYQAQLGLRYHGRHPLVPHLDEH